MTASVHAAEALLSSVLIQLVIMIGVARLMNIAVRKLGQPSAIGEIVAGLALAPSLFSYFFPEVSVALSGVTSSRTGSRPEPYPAATSRIEIEGSARRTASTGVRRPIS
jgi:hypothetical protein